MEQPRTFTEVLPLAKANIPKADVEWLRRKLDGMEDSHLKTEDDIRQLLAMVRLANPICDHCMYKDDLAQLELCPKCLLVFYCREPKHCKQQAWSKHSERCCNPDGPEDDGPMRPLILPVENLKKNRIL